MNCIFYQIDAALESIRYFFFYLKKLYKLHLDQCNLRNEKYKNIFRHRTKSGVRGLQALNEFTDLYDDRIKIFG